HAGSIIANLIACHEQLKQNEQAETWRRKWQGELDRRRKGKPLEMPKEQPPAKEPVQDAQPRELDGLHFQIISVDSGKALAVEEDSPKNGAKLIQRTATASAAQQWQLLKRAEYYLIVNRKSGKVLDVPNGTKDYVQIHLWDKEAADKQQWSVEKWDNYS